MHRINHCNESQFDDDINGYDFDVFLGTYTADEEIEFGTKIKGTGWKMVRFEGNQLMRITAYLILKSDIKVE